MRVGVVGGASFSGLDFLGDVRAREVRTPYGNVLLFAGDKIVYLPRHGVGRNIPPHMINHRANIRALADCNVTKIISVSSAGSLRKNIRPGSIMVPHDYVNLWGTPTFYDKKIVHITPQLDEELRKTITLKAGELKIEVIDGGVYVQTTGPRLETKAEIRVLKTFGDVVGMTMASEATLAQELGLAYATITSVDNYANGITEKPLHFEDVTKASLKNKDKIIRLLDAVADKLNGKK